MKVIRVIVALMLTISVLAVTVGAVPLAVDTDQESVVSAYSNAGSENSDDSGTDGFVPSAELNESIRFNISYDDEGREVIGRIFDENGEFERYIYLEELIITPIWYLEDEKIDVYEEIEQTLVDARDELKESTWQELISDFEARWVLLTDGAPVENAIITYIFDVRYYSPDDNFMTHLLTEGKSAEFDIVIDGITSDTLFLVGHKPYTTDQWQLEEYRIDGNNVITITVDSLSPFFIATDSGEAPEATVTSPQTGVNDYTAVAVVAAEVLAGLGVVCAKMSRRISVK